MGDFIGKIIKSTGNATRESGEDIYWRDVDYDKLKSLRESHPQVNSWSVQEGYRNNNNDSGIQVNDSKGGIGGLFHPSTSQVRQSLRTVDVPQTNYHIDPYTGFSEAFMANQSTPLPSSQGSVSPVSQARDSQEDNVTEYMGRPLSDDDDDNPRVGQIS